MWSNVQRAYYEIHINNVDSIRAFRLQVDTVQCNMLDCDSGKNEKYTPNFCSEIRENLGISMCVLEDSITTHFHDVRCENVDWFHVDIDKIQWRSSDVVCFRQTQTRVPCSKLDSSKFAPVHAVKACRGSKGTAPHILLMLTLFVKLRMPNLSNKFAVIGRRMKPRQTKHSGQLNHKQQEYGLRTTKLKYTYKVQYMLAYTTLLLHD
jgi:hypothetical protein